MTTLTADNFYRLQVPSYSGASRDYGCREERAVVTHIASAFQSRLASELAQIAIECSKMGWDGYQAKPVSIATCDRAMRFLLGLATWMTAPDLVPEADGQVALEWYQANGRTLSISIGESGPVHYAGLFGDNEEIHGVEPFLGSVPSRLFGLITEFLGTKAGR